MSIEIIYFIGFLLSIIFISRPLFQSEEDLDITKIIWFSILLSLIWFISIPVLIALAIAYQWKE